MVRAHGRPGGRGNLRVTKTPPLQSGVGGEGIARRIAPIAAACLHLWESMASITPRWLGRALATLGTSPTENAIANLVN